MTDMTYRQLGASGLTVSTVGVGCNAFGSRIDAEQTTAVVRAGLDAGILCSIRLTYMGGKPGESEQLLGQALGSARDDVIVATKFGFDMRGPNGPDWGVRGSRRYVRRAVDASLRRLGTDWIDLYQLHAPDPVTPIEETLAALSELVAAGKVRYVGSSNFTAWQVIDADWAARSGGTDRFISAQNKYSLYDRSVEDELVPACEHIGVGLLPFFPLEYGLLTGKYKRGEPAPGGTRLAQQTWRLERANFDLIEAIESFAAARGLTILQVAIGGLAAQPAVGSVIAGATRPEQVTANAAAGQWHPTDEDLEALSAISQPGA
jgi:aryl-alcohol dehydrogenase-like predicted oxidoreductase